MSTLLHVFNSTIPSVNFVFKNGKAAAFVAGKYFTDVESEIAELSEEVKNRHPHIYVDKDQVTIQSEMLDPMVALRAKFFAEFEEELAKKTDPSQDLGTYEQEKVVPASTQDIAAAAAGGDGNNLAARLAGLAAKSAQPNQ